MGILLWIALGLVAGAIAKLILPGSDSGGLIVTIVLGVVGAIAGGYIGTTVRYGTVTDFAVHSLVIAVGGALILLIGYRFVAIKGQNLWR